MGKNSKRLIHITEDYSVVQSSVSSQDLIERTVAKALRPKPKGIRPMAPEERHRKSKEREKEGRLKRLVEGKCTRCRKESPVEGGRMCRVCRDKGSKWVRRSEVKRRGYDDFN